MIEGSGTYRYKLGVHAHVAVMIEADRPEKLRATGIDVNLSSVFILE